VDHGVTLEYIESREQARDYLTLYGKQENVRSAQAELHGCLLALAKERSLSG
jgi:hypothetical protein